MLPRLRREYEELAQKKRLQFDDLDRMIARIVGAYSHLFPKYETKDKGSRRVYHFNAPGIFPISLEREHRGRDALLPKFARRAMDQIEDLLLYVEEAQL